MKVPEIYNTYLSVSRGLQNKPWRARKDFTDFEKTPDGVVSKKLESFFTRFPQIDPKEFFRAPYEVYKDEDLFPLSFYNTQKAIAIYSAVQKQKMEELPDTPGQINDIKKSLKYIAVECINKNITLSQYCVLKEGYTYKIFEDYTNKLINIYVLVQLPFFEDNLNSLTPQDRELYLRNVDKNIAKYKMRLNTSTRAKLLIDEGLRLINKQTNKPKPTNTN